jgi:hypothetical protein
LLQVFDKGFAMFMEADRDYKKLQDFSVTDGLPPIQPFAESPEFAPLAAAALGPDAAKRNELLAQMRAPEADLPLDASMEPHVLKIMEELQRKGLSLQSVIGAGGFSITISAIAKQNINLSVPAGTNVALKVTAGEAARAQGVERHHLGARLPLAYRQNRAVLLGAHTSR